MSDAASASVAAPPAAAPLSKHEEESKSAEAASTIAAYGAAKRALAGTHSDEKLNDEEEGYEDDEEDYEDDDSEGEIGLFTDFIDEAGVSGTGVKRSGLGVMGKGGMNAGGGGGGGGGGGSSSGVSSMAAATSRVQVGDDFAGSRGITNTVRSSVNESEKQLDKDRVRTKDKADRATSEQVLDPRTRALLDKFCSNGTLRAIHGCISTGKEANVYYAESAEGERAVKIYKTSILVFKDRDKYVTGEYRFRHGYCKVR